MKKFLTFAVTAALILSLTACSETNTSGSSSGNSGVASDNSDSSSSSDSSGSSDSSSSSGSSSSSDSSSDTQSEPSQAEEIPYTLGGELTPTMIANSIYNQGNPARLIGVIKNSKREKKSRSRISADLSHRERARGMIFAMPDLPQIGLKSSSPTRR